MKIFGQVRLKYYCRRRPFKSNRQENLEERMLDLDNSKHPIVKRIPGTRTIDIGDTINISFDNNIGAIPAVESCENDAGRPIPEKSEGIPEVRKNIFSTKLIDLDVDVDHVDECTSNGNQVCFIQFSSTIKSSELLFADS